MNSRSMLGLLLGVVSVAIVSDSRAQQSRLDLTTTPNYGARTLSPGFTPDPNEVRVTSGGSLDVSTMNLAPNCRGFVTAAPDLKITLTTADPFIRVFVDAGDADTTLIIRRPDGTFICADDTYGLNPGIDLTNAPAGVYAVWVGSFRAITRANGLIRITELRTVVPTVAAATPAPNTVTALDVSRRPNFGSRTLAPGFTPDPSEVRVTSGGQIDASTIGLPAGCGGWVTRQPDFNIVLSGPSASLRVYVSDTRPTEDVTLIINRADGTWVCNDDSYGTLNPTIDLTNALPGNYNVWVGSYRRRAMVRARLNVTELDRHP